jgi:hypothetical protein
MISAAATAGGTDSKVLMFGTAHHHQCQCCPFGFHIDRDFVEYVENVSSGGDGQSLDDRAAAARRRRTSIARKKKPIHRREHDDELETARRRHNYYEPEPTSRNDLMSPMDSIFRYLFYNWIVVFCVFSDSLENIVSDFEEALHNPHTLRNTTNNGTAYSSDVDYSPVCRRKNHQLPPTTTTITSGGYQSDYSVYASPQPVRRQQQQHMFAGGYSATLPGIYFYHSVENNNRINVHLLFTI